GERARVAAQARDAGLRAGGARRGGDPARHRLIPPLSGGLLDCDPGGRPREAAGTLFPQPTVATSDGHIALLDDVLPPVFLVVARSIDDLSVLSEREMAVLQRLGAVRLVLGSSRNGGAPPQGVVELTTKDDLFENWIEETQAVAAVVRPDRYVYGVARTASDLKRLVDQLTTSLFEAGITAN